MSLKKGGRLTSVSYLFALPAPFETVAVGSGGRSIMITSPKYRAAWSWGPRERPQDIGALARRTRSEEERLQLLTMAATWDGLAGERERLLSEQATETQSKVPNLRSR